MTKEKLIELLRAWMIHKRELLKMECDYTKRYDRELDAEALMLQEIVWILEDEKYFEIKYSIFVKGE